MENTISSVLKQENYRKEIKIKYIIKIPLGALKSKGRREELSHLSH